MGRAGSRTGRSKVRKRVGDSTRAASEGPRRGLHNRPGARPRPRGGSGRVLRFENAKPREWRFDETCDTIDCERTEPSTIAISSSSLSITTRWRDTIEVSSRCQTRRLVLLLHARGSLARRHRGLSRVLSPAPARKRRSSSSSADHSALCTNHSSPILIGGFPASTRPQCTMESSSGSVAPTIRYGIDDVTTTGASLVPLGALRNA